SVINSLNDWKFATARVISADGSLIGGSAHNASSGSRDPTTWPSSGTPVTDLGYLGNATGGNGAVNGLSTNGSVAYGFTAYNAATPGAQQAYRYSSGTMQGLGFFNAGDDNSY